MSNRSNTPVRARAEDQPLIEAIDDARRRYRVSAAAAEQLLNDFAKPEPRVRRWIFELSDPAPRANPFVTDDLLAAFYARRPDKRSGLERALGRPDAKRAEAGLPDYAFRARQKTRPDRRRTAEERRSGPDSLRDPAHRGGDRRRVPVRAPASAPGFHRRPYVAAGRGGAATVISYC
jgi:hypothetical protein